MMQESNFYRIKPLLLYTLFSYIFGFISCITFLFVQQFRSKQSFEIIEILTVSLVAGFISCIATIIQAFIQTRNRAGDKNRFYPFCTRELKTLENQTSTIIDVAEKNGFSVISDTDKKKYTFIKELESKNGLSKDKIEISFIISQEGSEEQISRFESRLQDQPPSWRNFKFRQEVQTELDNLLIASGLYRKLN